MKRAFDIVVSLLVMLLCLPLMLLIAIAIKLESQGSVFFCQQRVGYLGQEFLMFKLRSMVSDAESQGPYYTTQGDSRITKVGHFLRKTSLDEIPQILNVLLGDMSIVGPRPDVPVQRSNYTQQQWDKRNSVRPGITGLAQAVVRSNAVENQRLELDLEYVDKASLLFDCWIMLLTIKQLLITKGTN